MLIVRKAGLSDLDIIATLSRKTFYDTYHEQNTAENMQLFLETNFNAEALEREINDPKSIFIIAEEEGIPAGYAQLSERENLFEQDNIKAIEICRIYALKDKIGKGVGKALIQMCVEVAQEKGMDVIWLGVWDQNQRAIDFYTAQGFEKFGEHVFMLGNDEQNDWLMKRPVK